jgi:aromatase
MRSELTTWISAPPEAVFALAADIARWPERLPHYLYVRILARTGNETEAAMAARRGLIPVFWTALQTVDAPALRIRFRHLRGVTKGMEVLWTFEDEDGGTRATVVHDLELRWPVAGPWFARRVIEQGFIRPIACRTLRRFKEVAEEEAAAAERIAPVSASGAAS